MCVRMHIYIYIYIYTHMHTNIHICTFKTTNIYKFMQIYLLTQNQT